MQFVLIILDVCFSTRLISVQTPAFAQVYPSEMEVPHRKEKMKQNGKIETKMTSRWSSCGLDLVFFFCFIILHNGRTWVFYSDLILCFVKLNVRSRSFSFGSLSISMLKQRTVEPFRHRRVLIEQHLLQCAFTLR